MLRRLLPSLLAVAATAALPAGATAATPDAGLPSVESITPVNLRVGDVMTIRGANFVAGRFRDQVVFTRPGIRPVFVLADLATTDAIRLRVSARLLPYLSQRDGQPIATRFRLSVLSLRLNPSFTELAQSPVIFPPGEGALVPGAVDCDGDGAADTAQPAVLGVPVVGLRLPGIPLLLPSLREMAAEKDKKKGNKDKTDKQSDVPDVPGMEGVPNVEVPATGLPPASTPPPPVSPPPVCPAS